MKMRNIIILLTLGVLISSLASAEIIINQQPKDLYNLGDIITLPAKIVISKDTSSFFSMYLICNGIQTEIHKEYVTLSAGQEKQINPSIPLIKNFIGRTTGTCKIKSALEGEYALTNEFKISDLINVEIKTEKREFDPQENIIIEGQAVKENQEVAKGFAELKIINENSSVFRTVDAINNGYFYINFSLPENTKAGEYSIIVTVYEKDAEEETTNQGFADYKILIKQVPTNLEIAFETQEVEPGTNLKVKAILHDQTGEKISSNAIITIKNKENIILEQTEKPTDEFLEFPILYKEAPKEWKVVAVSNKLTNEATFRIKEKEEVKIELINKTIIIANTGNVQYNKTVLIKIGGESKNINVNLEIDETQRYTLSAPDGEYQIEVLTPEGSKITGKTTLTGKNIGVKKTVAGIKGLINYSFVWVFIISVLGFIAFTIFKKGYKRSFFGYIKTKKKEKNKEISFQKNPAINTVNTINKAELSLSIKGEPQDISLICLKIKNFEEIESKRGAVEETMQKLSSLAEENKAMIYKSQGNLFFIFAPLKTKTFKNERNAAITAQKIENILTNHNKLFKQKIEFGIALNYGRIIAKQEKNILEFMSLGTLITTAKKIASISNGEILLSEKIKEKLMSDIKTEKQRKAGIDVYTIREIRDHERNKKFINSFLRRNEMNK